MMRRLPNYSWCATHAFSCAIKTTATTQMFTLSLQTLFRSRSGELQPVPYGDGQRNDFERGVPLGSGRCGDYIYRKLSPRSEEHTSELQSHSDLVCRLLLEKKKQQLGVHILLAETEPHRIAM